MIEIMCWFESVEISLAACRFCAPGGSSFALRGFHFRSRTRTHGRGAVGVRFRSWLVAWKRWCSRRRLRFRYDDSEKRRDRGALTD
jgi:hypothetical protein